MSDTICPTCGGAIDTDDMVWFVSTRFYCSEACARAARPK